MAIRIEDLEEGKNYFISVPHIVLFDEEWNEKKGKLVFKGVNHLLLGDWLTYLGTTRKFHNKSYARVACRGDKGWLDLKGFGEKRALEVNFVDIGQGDGCHIVTPKDEIILIDAGELDNMNRFISWRYNLRNRNVKGTKGFDSSEPIKDPKEIDYTIISHPDFDHYGGFQTLFANSKLKFSKVFHNGIIERPGKPDPKAIKKFDLGGMFEVGEQLYLFDYVTEDTRVREILEAAPNRGRQKEFIKMLRNLYDGSDTVEMKGVGVEIDNLNDKNFLEGFDESNEFSLQLLGPIRETQKCDGEDKLTVRMLVDEGKTKNGHSVILKAKYENLTMLLGGDLNTPSQNFLLKCYADAENEPEQILKDLYELSKLEERDEEQESTLIALKTEFEQILHKGSEVFKVDVAKACHHGSQHILDTFIEVVNAQATVISSGDSESHSHPRPSALGAYGKYGRGKRPLIFSTELARSTNEFTPKIKYYEELKDITLKIANETDEDKKDELIAAIENKKDRNVAVYGMITLRALGDQVIIAQKLEKARSASQKWDIYQLDYSDAEGHFIYDHH